MSQFEQKYYKHYLTKERRPVQDELSERNPRTFTWWHKWGLFEYLTLFLLLAILACLCFRCGGISLGNTHALNASAVSLPKPTLPVGVPAVGGGAVTQLPQGEERVGAGESSNLPQLETSKRETLALGERFPTKVVPKVKKLMQNIGKPVSIEDYLYFAHETQSGYPDFIDPKTSRLIISKKPDCFKLECPVTGILERDKKAYAAWLTKLTHTDYTVHNRNDSFVLDIK